MAMSSRLLLIAAATVTLGACNTMHKNIGQDDPGMGEAVKYNAAVQTVNPDPVYRAGDAQPGDSGAKGAAAVKRYRTDAVKPVETMQTTSGGGSPR
jgi:predicted small secreted protein